MIVFAGPSVAGIADSLPDLCDLRPPAQQGDIYLAALERPSAIGLIDGYFEGVPAVWHKEILWALTQGIAVLGASSMGALRAAELDAFGMIGIGAIYGAYRDGKLEDDDEVALLHGPAELGYPGLSLAMVNLRATLAAAQAAKVVSPHEVAFVISRAKAQFYKQRSWQSLLSTPDPVAFPAERCATLAAWSAQNEVDQKRIDAQQLLDRMAAGAFETPKPDFHFEQTLLWQASKRVWRQRAARNRPPAQDGHRKTSGLSFLDD